VAAWLTEGADCEAIQAVRRIMATHPPVRALIEATASSSAYLWELARADPARLVSLLGTDPDERLASLRAAAAGHSGRDDISERIEEILTREVSA